MFHPKNLVCGGLLETVWKAVHDITIEVDDEENNLPEIWYVNILEPCSFENFEITLFFHGYRNVFRVGNLIF